MDAAHSLIIINALAWRWNKKNIEKITDPSLLCDLYFEIGSMELLPPMINNFDTILDAKGSLVVPGLVDSHIHISMIGESKNFVDLKDCYSVNSLIEKIKCHIERNPNLPWIIGVNWDQSRLSRFPRREDLDTISIDKPIFLWRECWHIGCSNSKALVMSKILKKDESSQEYEFNSSLCPEGGEIELDPANNLPNGILKERAVELIQNALRNNIESPGLVDEKIKFLSQGLHLCPSYGLTSVQTNDTMSLSNYQKLKESGQSLPLRVFLTPDLDDLEHSSDVGGVKDILPFRSDSLCNRKDSISSGLSCDKEDSKLVYERVKIFSDGSLGAMTAAIRNFDRDSEDRKDDSIRNARKRSKLVSSSDYSGLLIHHDSNLLNLMKKAYQKGYRLEIHAIGDAAVDQILNILVLFASETVAAMIGKPPSNKEVEKFLVQYRVVLTHCQVLGPDLIEIMSRYKIIANVQPSFVPTDMKWVESRLSKRQLDYSYIWKTLMTKGVPVAGGSDAPIEHPSPLIGIYDAMMRSNKHRIKNEPEKNFKPQEKLNFEEALYIYTIGGAYACFCENLMGQIEPGYLGDLVFLDKEVLNDPERLMDPSPLATMVGGQLTFLRPASLQDEFLSVSKHCNSTFYSKFLREKFIHQLDRDMGVSQPKNPSTQEYGAPLSDAPYFPGRGGDFKSIRESCSPCQKELFCACRLLGKYCAEL